MWVCSLFYCQEYKNKKIFKRSIAHERNRLTRLLNTKNEQFLIQHMADWILSWLTPIKK